MGPNEQDPWEALVTRLIGDLPMLGGAKQAPAAPVPLPMVPPTQSAVAPAMSSAPNPISTFLAGLGKGGGAILPALGEGMKAVQGSNATKAALLSRGASEQDVDAALANPALMQQLLASIFAPKMQKMGPNEALVTAQGKEVYRNQDKFVNVPEGGTLFDPNTRQPVFGNAPKLPELVKDYEYYKAQETTHGRVPKPFDAWDLDRKKAGALNVVMSGETEQSKDLGKDRAKREIDIRNAGDKAYDELGVINIMRQAMKDPNFYSGIGAETFALPIKQFMATFGADPNTAASLEAFRGQANRSTLTDIGGSLGTAISNADRDFIAQINPRLGNTPAGNEVMLTIKERLARRKIEVAQRQEDYIADNGKVDQGWATALRKWRDANPLFTEQDKQLFGSAAQAGGGPTPTQQGAGTDAAPATPKTFEDALKLPKGFIFIVPDGPEKGKKKVR